MLCTSDGSVEEIQPLLKPRHSEVSSADNSSSLPTVRCDITCHEHNGCCILSCPNMVTGLHCEPRVSMVMHHHDVIMTSPEPIFRVRQRRQVSHWVFRVGPCPRGWRTGGWRRRWAAPACSGADQACCSCPAYWLAVAASPQAANAKGGCEMCLLYRPGPFTRTTPS